jgi:hypothetical protein
VCGGADQQLHQRVFGDLTAIIHMLPRAIEVIWQSGEYRGVVFQGLIKDLNASLWTGPLMIPGCLNTKALV